MARASIWTFLSLDRYARIMGINPVHFSGSGQINLMAGGALFPLYNAQNNIWPQHAWQNSDQISREDLALEIWKAEQDLIEYFRFYPAPSWVEGDVYHFSGHYRPEFGVLDTDVNGQPRGVQLRMKKFIAGGRRKADFIENVAISYFDTDSDGWDETVAINVDITGHNVASLYEVRVFFQNQGGAREWEIRTPKSKVQVGNIVTFQYNVWQVISPTAVEDFPTDGGDGKSVDISTHANNVTRVDIYRVYNDTTQDHAEFISINGNTGTETKDGGFLYMRQHREEVVVPVQGTYDAVNGWAASSPSNANCSNANHVKLWYYSGYSEYKQAWLANDDWLNDRIASAIAFLATARLERIFYANDNATSLAANLRSDITIDEDGRRYYSTEDVLNNPFGTKVGEVKAWRIFKNFFKDRRIGVAVL